mgnify:CR=1 FL=1
MCLLPRSHPTPLRCNLPSLPVESFFLAARNYFFRCANLFSLHLGGIPRAFRAFPLASWISCLARVIYNNVACPCFPANSVLWHKNSHFFWKNLPEYLAGWIDCRTFAPANEKGTPPLRWIRKLVGTEERVLWQISIDSNCSTRKKLNLSFPPLP